MFAEKIHRGSKLKHWNLVKILSIYLGKVSSSVVDNRYISRCLFGHGYYCYYDMLYLSKIRMVCWIRYLFFPCTGCYAGFCFFFGGGVNSKNGGGTQKLYFVRFHAYPKRGAFAGCSVFGGWQPLRGQKNFEKLTIFQINNIKFAENCKIVLKNIWLVGGSGGGAPRTPCNILKIFK